MSEFYYQLMGENFGPISAMELRRLVLDGRIDRETLLRPANHDQWIRAERISHLFDRPTEPEHAEREVQRTATVRPPNTQPSVASEPDQSESLAQILARHLNTSIGINYRNAETVELATLVAVSGDHLSVQNSETGLVYHFPLRMVLSAVEAEDGNVSFGGVFSKKECRLVVQVLHMIIYSGAIGVSF